MFCHQSASMASLSSGNESLAALKTVDNQEKEIVKYLIDQHDTSNIVPEFAF